MDEAAVGGGAAGRDDPGQASPAPGPEPDDFDRLQTLEQQVRQLTSRLAGWVEAQLVQSLDDRRHDMKALRSELQILIDEQLEGMRAEASSVLLVATRRLEFGQEQLAERLGAVADRTADATARAIALSGSSSSGSERMDMLEHHFGRRLTEMQEQMNAGLAAVVERQRADGEIVRAEVTSGLAVLAGLPSAADAVEERVRAAMSRLNDSVDARLAAVDLGDVHERLAALVAEAAAAGTGGVSLTADFEAVPGRLDAFEQRVKAAMGRLTDAVEARLEETVTARASDIDTLRTELTDRIDRIERAAARTAEGLPALQLSVLAGAERTEALERDTKATVARMAESLESSVVELSTSRKAQLDALHSETTTTARALTERLDSVATAAAALAGEVSALRAGAEAGTARTGALEQRVKAAVGRLAESVEAKLGEFAASRSAEVDVATSALRARLVQVQERIDAVEQENRGVADRVGQVMEAKLAEVVERRRDELEGVKAEIQQALATQLRDARGEIGLVVADAHRRFVVSVDQLEERMHVVAEQATAAWTAVAGVETWQETVVSNGRRIEALETHTRRTDARLGEVVQAKLAEQAGDQGTQLEEVRDELRAAVDKVQDQVAAALQALPGEVRVAVDGLQSQMRDALDAHLAETRAEVTLALGQGRAELAAGAEQLEALELALEQQSTKAVAGIDALRTSVEAALQGAEERLTQAVESRLVEAEAVVTQVAGARTESAAAVASVNRKVARVQDQVQKKLAAIADQIEALANADVEHVKALVKAVAAETGALAPLRSDLRMLQGQVGELAEVIAALRPKRKAPTAPARKAAAPARKAVAPARKAAAPARKAPATKAAAPARKAAATVPAEKTTRASRRKRQ